MIPTWQIHASKVQFYYDNLLNVMRQLSLNSHGILTTQLSEVNDSNTEVFYVFRNGEGETLRVMNESNWEFIREEQAKLAEVLKVCGVIGGIAILLLITCFLAVILPTIIAVDRSNQNIWSFFYKLPSDIVQDLRFHCEERLEATHGIDLSQQFSPRKSSSAPPQFQREFIKCTRKWPYIARRLWIYYLISLAYGVYFYIIVYTNLANLLLHLPELTNLTGERTLAIQSSYLWLRETVMRENDYTHTFPWSESLFHPSSKQHLDSLLERLRSVEDDILTGHLGREGEDRETRTMSLQDMCSYLGENCGDTGLVRGVHGEVLSYLLDSAYYSSQSSPTPAFTKEVTDLLSSELPLHNSTQLLMHTYSSVLTARVQDLELQIELVTALYCLLSFVFYFIIYLPMTVKVRKQLTNIWDLASLIPTEFIERITRALKKANST